MVACLCTKVDQWQTSRQQGALLRRLGRLLVAPTPTACGAVRAMAALVRNDGHLAGKLVLLGLAAVIQGRGGLSSALPTQVIQAAGVCFSLLQTPAACRPVLAMGRPFTQRWALGK